MRAYYRTAAPESTWNVNNTLLVMLRKPPITSRAMAKGIIDPLRVRFGALLKHAREGANITQKQLEEAGIVSEVHLSRIETGESGTKRETIKKIARFIHWNIADALEAAGLTPTPEELKEAGRVTVAKKTKTEKKAASREDERKVIKYYQEMSPETRRLGLELFKRLAAGEVLDTGKHDE